MLLNEKSELLQNIINNLNVFTDETDETKTAIYEYILYNYGARTVSPILEHETSYTPICNFITLLYRKKWEYLKKINDSDISVDTISDETTETTDTDIYGFNDDSGVNDNKVTRTIKSNKEYSDVFGNFSKVVDFTNKFSYYNSIIVDVVSELTTCVYE